LAALAVAVPLLGVATVMLMSKPDADRHHMVRQVTVLRLPPPPPKPEEKPPEPPKPKEQIKLDQPKPVDEPKSDQSEPPTGPLGLDTQGTGPGDGFGLAGRPGGRDIVLGASGGGELAALTFGNGAARHIAQELARNPALKGANFRIEIYVWLSKDGRLEREVIARGSGDPDLDARIREALTRVSPLKQPLPPDVPQPLRIRVTSSDA
jgi:protein TonB